MANTRLDRLQTTLGSARIRRHCWFALWTRHHLDTGHPIIQQCASSIRPVLSQQTRRLRRRHCELDTAWNFPQYLSNGHQVLSIWQSDLPHEGLEAVLHVLTAHFEVRLVVLQWTCVRFGATASQQRHGHERVFSQRRVDVGLWVEKRLQNSSLKISLKNVTLKSSQKTLSKASFSHVVSCSNEWRYWCFIIHKQRRLNVWKVLLQPRGRTVRWLSTRWPTTLAFEHFVAAEICVHLLLFALLFATVHILQGTKRTLCRAVLLHAHSPTANVFPSQRHLSRCAHLHHVDRLVLPAARQRRKNEHWSVLHWLFFKFLSRFHFNKPWNTPWAKQITPFPPYTFPWARRVTVRYKLSVCEGMFYCETRMQIDSHQANLLLLSLYCRRKLKRSTWRMVTDIRFSQQINPSPTETFIPHRKAWSGEGSNFFNPRFTF